MKDIVERLLTENTMYSYYDSPAIQLDAAREITRLREQLHLANIDAIGAHAEANDLRDRVSTLSELLSEYMRACGSLVSPRIEKKAIAALEAKP